MKEQIMQNLAAVLNALNNVSTSGKENLGNLSGSIVMLENIFAVLSDCDIVGTNKDEQVVDLAGEK